ncbi:MAG: PilZ domain-containing protein [Proteobacteria bacterium]|nr:PilZ domain-containing protein [Pseudomonadota bacterium]
MLSKRRELRSDVRTSLSYAVKYEIISPEEYYLIKNKSDSLLNPDRKKLKIDPVLSDNNAKIDSDLKIDYYDDALLKFLVKMDEKLDIILSMLSTNEARSKTFNQGTCNNISASGISLVTSEPASKGQIVHVNIDLCKLPPVYIDAYGEIVRTTGIYEDNIPMYNLGIKFIDLDEKDREKIVAYIFSKQREDLRNGKTGSDQHMMDS